MDESSFAILLEKGCLLVITLYRDLALRPKVDLSLTSNYVEVSVYENSLESNQEVVFHGFNYVSTWPLGYVDTVTENG